MPVLYIWKLGTVKLVVFVDIVTHLNVVHRRQILSLASRVCLDSRSASSLAAMPCSFPSWIFKGTLAPSSSSSNLRTELFFVSGKDAFSNRMSSVSGSCGSVGSLFSKRSIVPQSLSSLDSMLGRCRSRSQLFDIHHRISIKYRTIHKL